MKKSIVFSIGILIMGGFYLSAQDSLSNGNALNFPAKKYGISIGNSYEFTGIRINFADENVNRINGLNLTFWVKRAMNMDCIVNGISLGVIPTGGSLRPVNIGVLGVGANKELSGLNLAGVVIGTGGRLNGLSLSGLFTKADTITGISVSGLTIASKKINGVASSVGFVLSEHINGIVLSSFSHTTQMNGLSVALFNKATELHGLQLGLINYAENNPKGLRILPLLNFHF